MSAFGTILLTTDFSELSARAVMPSRALAERFGSRIFVVHILEDRIPPFLEEFLADHEDTLRRQQQRAAEELERFAARELGADFPWETVVAVGTPHQEIVRLAEEREVDLIVMATHGRGPLGHVLIGSTTERVLHRAPCPVLAVRVSGARS
jgi:nucleotide-binding universal stress UspA family protein